jgi:flavodoxin
MPSCIIFHSYSGITRGIAEKIEKACGGRLIEVVPRKAYNRLTVYLAGGRRAMKGEADPVDPERIDVAACDLLVIGTPVWAGNPTPVINAAIAGLANCEGKKAVLFATCGMQAGKTLEVMTRALEAKGVAVAGAVVFSRKEIGDERKVQELVGIVKTVLAATGP